MTECQHEWLYVDDGKRKDRCTKCEEEQDHECCSCNWDDEYPCCFCMRMSLRL